MGEMTGPGHPKSPAEPGGEMAGFGWPVSVIKIIDGKTPILEQLL
jgi:hypothetical protein